jgi:TonB family protein
MRTPVGISLFAAAVAASAAAHAVLVASFSVIRVGSATSLPGVGEAMVVYVAPDRVPEPDPDEFDIGLPLASGYATHAAEGRLEQIARQAPQDQPQLSLDPVGRSLVVDVPSAPAEVAAPRSVAAPQPVPAPVDSMVRRATDEMAQWVPPAPVQPPVVAAAPAPPAPPAPVSASGTGADPAPMSDSEVDAFSVLGSAEFRGGKVSVQSGRQVKTRRPKIGLAGMVELAQHTAVRVVLKVAVDPTGKVTDVNVLRSSGSNEIDQPCRVAMYEWWFEPRKDAAGQPVPDVFQFTISFR